LKIKAGETVALVGGSGCGKSTVTQLIQRFYDPVAGSVFIDNYDLKDLNIPWIRDRIALVGQEPVLFATTVEKNISYGARRGATATRAEVEQAAKSSNAYDFITEFPEGFDTYIGHQGGLSGGQKQRVAIARAIIRDPSILILDEATSALDNTSERVVQDALDELMKQHKRTTLVIAHRLSTVRNADKIVVLGNGGVLEQGSHDELLKIPNGHYCALVQAAERSQENGNEASLKDLIDEDDEISERFGSSSSAARRASKSQHENPAAVAVKSEIKENIEEEGDDSEEVVATSKGCCGKKKKEKKELYTVPMSRIFNYSKPEKWWYIPGVLASMINGAVMPVFAILFAGISNVFFLPTIALMRHDANSYSLYFVYLSVGVALCFFGAFYLFGFIGERMTTRVRSELFQALLRQEVAFFDDRKNAVGALSSQLSQDAAMVKASLGDRMGLMVQNLSTVIVGLAIAFSYGWKLTLVLMALLPIIVVAGAMEMMAMKGFATQDDESMADASSILSESIGGIRTVTAFALRNRVVMLYDSYLVGPSKLALKKGCIGGFSYGLSQGSLFAIYSVAFYYGSRLIVYDNYSFQDMINVFFAVVMMGFGMGQAAAMSPDIGKASAAIDSVFRVIDRKSAIDPFNLEGYKDEAETNQDIVLSKVDFAYPTRPDAKVFDQFSLCVPNGHTVALVGQSGSGKSTMINFLERFYDPSAGTVMYHGIDVREANVKWLRDNVGFVQQEPQLFDTTIFENIAYGVPLDPENPVPVTQEQVEEAAKAANAHDFIMAFPDGYQTQCGRGGKQLSGGQKQRVCLARCIIRNPKVLLLDEATSALDNESERIVQDALDRLMEDKTRTTIVIAHRLTTIQNSDLICVVDHGKIVEKGTHDELLENKEGIYYKMYTAQDRSKN